MQDIEKYASGPLNYPAEHRWKLVTWLTEVILEQKLPWPVFYTAVNIYDRWSDHRVPEKGRRQLYIIASLDLAMYIYSYKQWPDEFVVGYTANSYTVEELNKARFEIITLLAGDLAPTTLYDYGQRHWEHYDHWLYIVWLATISSDLKGLAVEILIPSLEQLFHPSKTSPLEYYLGKVVELLVKSDIGKELPKDFIWERSWTKHIPDIVLAKPYRARTYLCTHVPLKTVTQGRQIGMGTFGRIYTYGPGRVVKVPLIECWPASVRELSVLHKGLEWVAEMVEILITETTIIPVLKAYEPLPRHPPLPLTMYGLAKAVQGLNRHGFVHADIKLANILAGPVLIDFGLAIRPIPTRIKVMYSDPYTPPEIYYHRTIHIKSDIWALGLAYLALLLPLSLDTYWTNYEDWYAKLPRLIKDNVPSPFRNFISHMIEPDVNLRWTIEEVLAELPPIP